MEDTPQKNHHVRDDLCTTRPRYREGRKLKAVKVYTVSQESQYLLVQGIPAIKLKTEVLDLFSSYGEVCEYRVLEDYPAEEFTEVVLIKFARIQSARVAKKFVDDYNFYGGVLHVCYAPEYESVDETSQKLQERKKSVTRRIRLLNKEAEELRRNQAEQEETTSSSKDRTNVISTEGEDTFSAVRTTPSDLTEHPAVIDLSDFLSTPAEPVENELYPPLPPPPCVMPSYFTHPPPCQPLPNAPPIASQHLRHPFPPYMFMNQPQ